MARQNESDKTKEAVQGLSALYGGVLQNLSMAQSADNAIEAKAVGVTALSLAMITLTVQQSDQWHALMIIGLLLLATSIFCAFQCLKINDYQCAAVKVADHPEYTQKIDRDLLLQLIADAELGYDDVSATVKTKAKFFTWSYALLLFGALICLASLKFIIVKI